MVEATSRPVTMAQVAEYAGVSQATVSRVLNGVTSVDPAIASKVTRAMAALNYSPSEAARSLVRGRSHTVALVVPDLENPMFQGVLKGFTLAAARDGYRVLVADSAENVDDETEIALEARGRCDALVLVSPRMSEADLHALVQRASPVVVINRDVDHAATPQLVVDYEGAVRELGQHLIDYGHRRIAYVAGPHASFANERRLQGLRRLERENPGIEILTVPAGSSMGAGYAAAERVLERGASAALAFNDLTALGLLSRLRELGVDVPGELSVAGMDDIPMARYAAPPLTTMSVPRIDIGRQAWVRMKESMADEPVAPALYYRPSLVARESTGPAFDASGWVGPARPMLRLGGTVVAQYDDGTTVDSVLSPRPFLDRVVSRAGTALTTTMPADHPHHLGISLALPDVNGTSYWGGRTYVRGEGSIMLLNQGRQRRDGLQIDGHRLEERLSWIDETGTTQFIEQREIRSSELESGWALNWKSVLTTTLGRITIGSPATNGREGAGYGGIFWRFARGDARVFSPAGDREELVHGAATPWVAIVLPARRTTVLLTQPGEPLPWFVRVAEYIGVGPAVAWDQPHHMPEGSSLTLELGAYVVDEVLDLAGVERILSGKDES